MVESSEILIESPSSQTRFQSESFSGYSFERKKLLLSGPDWPQPKISDRQKENESVNKRALSSRADVFHQLTKDADAADKSHSQSDDDTVKMNQNNDKHGTKH